MIRDLIGENYFSAVSRLDGCRYSQEKEKPVEQELMKA